MPNPYDNNQNRRNANGPYNANGNRNSGYTPGHNGQYRKGDAPNQIPWWIIILLFCIGGWPISVILILLNSLMRNGTLDFSGRRTATNRTTTHPIYTDTARRVAYDSQTGAPLNTPANAPARPAAMPKKSSDGAGAENVLMVLGIVFAALGAIAVAGSVGDAFSLVAAGSSVLAGVEDILTSLVFLGGGIGMLFGSGKMKTSRRMRKKIQNIVGNSDYMYIRDIADAVPCSYEKCCGYLENCIDKGVFGEGAYLDMRANCLVVRGKAPQQTKAEAQKTEQAAEAAKGNSKYTNILEQLHRVNDAIPDEGMTDKITRLERVSAKIFKQAESNPDKLPQMRKFMDYYLPTSLKLLQTYAELEAQGIEGENISESKHRIEQSMDTLVVAFENQLDKLFQEDALDVSADIDVMENMLRADGLSGGNDPFGLYGDTPAAPQPPQNQN